MHETVTVADYLSAYTNRKIPMELVVFSIIDYLQYRYWLDESDIEIQKHEDGKLILYTRFESDSNKPVGSGPFIEITITLEPSVQLMPRHATWDRPQSWKITGTHMVNVVERHEDMEIYRRTQELHHPLRYVIEGLPASLPKKGKTPRVPTT